jgi:hypothetical protein
LLWRDVHESAPVVENEHFDKPFGGLPSLQNPGRMTLQYPLRSRR